MYICLFSLFLPIEAYWSIHLVLALQFVVSGGDISGFSPLAQFSDPVPFYSYSLLAWETWRMSGFTTGVLYCWAFRFFFSSTHRSWPPYSLHVAVLVSLTLSIFSYNTYPPTCTYLWYFTRKEGWTGTGYYEHDCKFFTGNIAFLPLPSLPFSFHHHLFNHCGHCGVGG